MSERVQTAQTVPVVAHGRRVRLGAIVALAILAGFVAWLFLKSDDNKADAPTRAPAVATSYSQLQALPGKVGHEVYWAGKKTGYTYELTQTSQGNIFVRYLPAGAAVGDPRPNFLTVGTYPRRDAYTALKTLSTKQDSVSRKLANGGIAVYSKQRPSSVYAAYPKKGFQVEVYDPSPARARQLVFSGQLRLLP
jgi:hypothetical protein